MAKKRNDRSRAKDAARRQLPPIPSNAGDLELYNPASLRDQEDAALTREYKRMREVIRKRQERMKKAGYGWTDAYQRGAVGHFPPISKIGSREELRYRLSDAARYIASKETTIKGRKEMERKQLTSLHKAGYDKIQTAEDLRAFGKFMESMRARYGKNLMGIPSDQVAAMFDPRDTMSADGFSAASDVDHMVAKHFFGEDEDEFEEDYDF